MQAKLAKLTCRWGAPQEKGALAYLIECVLDEERNKQGAIRGAAYAWGISMDQSKFFYAWVLAAMRAEFSSQIRVPFTEQDLWLLRDSYEHIPDLLHIMPWDALRSVMIRYGGMRLKIPTIATLARLKEEHAIWEEIDASDKDPDSISAIAVRHKKTLRGATEIYEEMCLLQDPNRSGEFNIYGSDDNG